MTVCRPGRLCSLVVLVAMTVGCTAGRLSTRGYPTPTVDELWSVVRARQAAVQSVNIEARATSWLGGERVRGIVQMLVGRSGQLRFEAEVALQGTVALLAVSDGRFGFIDNQKRLFRQGPACPANVAALIRIPLQPAEVAAILLGDVPLPADQSGATVAWDGARAADVLVVPGPSKSTLWLGLRRPNPKLAAWDAIYLEGQEEGGKGKWRVAYEDLERVGAVALPRLVRFAEAGKDWDDGVEIKIRDRELNPSFPEGAFSLEPPAGYKVETAACGGR